MEQIRKRIEADNFTAGRRIVETIYDAVVSLKDFPYRGRPGTYEGSRELVLTPLPYIVVYRVSETHVEVSRIWHGAQRRH